MRSNHIKHGLWIKANMHLNFAFIIYMPLHLNPCHALVIILYLPKDQQNFSEKDKLVNIVGFVGQETKLRVLYSM